MREIKYKAWDIAHLKMYQVGAMDWDGNGEVISVNCVDGPKLYRRPSGWAHSFVLREYTRLKDKNGMEIYEGDILRGFSYPFVYEKEENYFAVIEWGDDIAGFFSYPQRCSDRVRGGAVDDYVFDEGQRSAKWFEVIGNIYENPELLNV